MKAYNFSKEAHEGQLRNSGDPFFSHPVEVACILISLKMDVESIVAGLLHDVIEDTDTTYETISELFGDVIANIVNHLTALTCHAGNPEILEYQGLKRFFLAITDDPRILIIKLADRLHNMRTLHYVEDVRKRKIKALETMEIYAPLARRINLYEIYEELSDLSFKHLDPTQYKEIRQQIYTYYIKHQNFIDKTIITVEDILSSIDIEGRITGRLKSVHSVWRKSEYYRIDITKISDIIGFRITVNTIEECYDILNALLKHFNTPSKIKDYIKEPKKNNYQSIHLSITIPHSCKHIELQIRTKEMHKNAEYGTANHGHYKQKYLLFEWIKKNMHLEVYNFIQKIKMLLTEKTIFCFTQHGKIVALKNKHTCLDFAFKIHRDIGKNARFALINGKASSLRRRIKNGDEVFIVTNYDPDEHIHLKKFFNPYLGERTE